MKFDKILQYQKIEQEALSLKAEMAKSEAWQRFQDAQSKLEAATASIGKLTNEANELLKNYEKMRSRIDAIKSELADFDGILEGVQDVTEADYYLKLISAISEKLTALEKEANGVASRIDQINSAYSKTWEQGVRATQACKNAKAEYGKYAAAFKDRFDEMQKQLIALAKEIPDDIMSEYNRLKRSQKLPIYVKFDAEHKVCGRCRTEVSNDVCAKLKTPGDYAECPNCRRILYVAEN